MKIAYTKAIRWKTKSKALLEKVIKVVEDYHSQGYRMTLRQLYYQLVASEILPNQQKEYAKLSKLLTEARLAGLVDWDIIEDRVRVPKRPSQFDDIPELIDAAISSYRRDRWEDQDYFCEVWVEKDALSGVLSPLTSKYHCTLMVNRGYSSATAMHDAALRLRQHEDRGKECSIIYIGDFDPSGEDMVRDIKARLKIFQCDAKVEKIALTMDQVRKYKLPPNPAKMTDPRAGVYTAKHGMSSWEVDALRPDVLHKLLEGKIEEIIDLEKYEAVIALENKEIKKLKKLTRNI